MNEHMLYIYHKKTKQTPTLNYTFIKVCIM